MNEAPRPQSVSAQRLSRLSLWLRLTVSWFAAHVLALAAPQAAACFLAKHARDTRMLLVSRAVKAARFRRGGVITADMRRLTSRGVAGVKLRRALHTGTFSQRARAICDALAAPDRWIAYIVKRLRRGFTKLQRAPALGREKVTIVRAAPSPRDAINSS
ncbi:MAG: hypothetical protein ABUL42_01440 [Terricaulis silvestris]